MHTDLPKYVLSPHDTMYLGTLLSLWQKHSYSITGRNLTPPSLLLLCAYDYTACLLFLTFIISPLSKKSKFHFEIPYELR